MKNRYDKKEFIKIVEKSINLSDVCRNINLEPYYGNRQTIKKYIDKYNIDISHFKFNCNNNFKNFKKIKTKDILVENSTYNTCHLKHRLYKEKLKERKCEICHQDENWNGKKMSLILDHKNGIHTDNRLENLRIVCPNCNATLDTHGGKNIGENFKYNYTTDLKKEKKYYCECGNEKSKNSKKCVTCHNILQRKVDRPDIKILKKEVDELGLEGTGRIYNVTGNSIKKWIKMGV